MHVRSREMRLCPLHHASVSRPFGRDMATLESRGAALEVNQKMIFNRFAQLAGMDPPYTATVTITPTPSDANVTWTNETGDVLGQEASYTAQIGDKVIYVVAKTGYEPVITPYDITEDITIAVTLQPKA